MSFQFTASRRGGEPTKRESAPAATATATAAVAAAFPAFPLQPVPLGEPTLPGFLPLLEAIVSRHLAVSESLCAAPSAAQGPAFHQAVKAACAAFLGSARQRLALEAADSGSSQANPKNVANRAREAELSRQEEAYTSELEEWRRAEEKYAGAGAGGGARASGVKRKQRSGEEEEEAAAAGEEEEELDQALIEAHLGAGGLDQDPVQSTLLNELDDLARGMRAASSRMLALRAGTAAATKALHDSAAASVGAVGSKADTKSLLRGMAGASDSILSPKRLLAGMVAKGEGGSSVRGGAAAAAGGAAAAASAAKRPEAAAAAAAASSSSSASKRAKGTPK